MTPAADLFLAIDTSGADAGLVLSGAGRTDVLPLEAGPSGSARTEDLAAVASRLLALRGASPTDLTLVAAVVGPGSYTGLRSGLAFLRGLSFDGAIPAIAVGSLELLAWRGGRPGESVLAVSDAGSGRYAVARYARKDHDVEEESEPVVIQDTACSEMLRETSAAGIVLATPEAAFATAFLEAAAACRVPVRRAEGRSLARLAELVGARREHGRTVRVSELLPLYVGEARAKPNRHRVAISQTSN